MTVTLGLLATTNSGVEWTRPLMIGWVVIALTLSFIEVWLLTDGFSSRRVPESNDTCNRSRTHSNGKR